MKAIRAAFLIGIGLSTSLIAQTKNVYQCKHIEIKITRNFPKNNDVLTIWKKGTPKKTIIDRQDNTETFDPIKILDVLFSEDCTVVFIHVTQNHETDKIFELELDDNQTNQLRDINPEKGGYSPVHIGKSKILFLEGGYFDNPTFVVYSTKTKTKQTYKNPERVIRLRLFEGNLTITKNNNRTDLLETTIPINKFIELIDIAESRQAKEIRFQDH